MCSSPHQVVEEVVAAEAVAAAAASAEALVAAWAAEAAVASVAEWAAAAAAAWATVAVFPWAALAVAAPLASQKQESAHPIPAAVNRTSGHLPIHFFFFSYFSSPHHDLHKPHPVVPCMHRATSETYTLDKSKTADPCNGTTYPKRVRDIKSKFKQKGTEIVVSSKDVSQSCLSLISQPGCLLVVGCAVVHTRGSL